MRVQKENNPSGNSEMQEGMESKKQSEHMATYK